MKPIGFFGALTLLFIALKLFGVTAVANWSWVWVLSPFWGYGLFVVAIIVLALLTPWVVALWIKWQFNRRYNRKD